MRVEHWAFCRQDTLDAVFPDGFPGIALEHAAVIETSMMLHYHPQLVSLERIPSHGPAQFPIYDMYPARTAWVPSSGVLSSAKDSSREKGRRLVTDVVDGIAAAVRHEFGCAKRLLRRNGSRPDQARLALSRPKALSAEPGTVRNATFARFQPLMAITSKVKSDSSFSEKCARTLS